ncbi:MAG: hypothetical protein HKN79_02520 [Flavobacteriales bacterium]|nr:hypothetical protein [Flavobacteriales bacterium]
MRRLLLSVICAFFFSQGLLAQWGVGISASPFLDYTGNLIGPSSTIPTWQGGEGIPRALDVFRYRSESDDWIRYRLQTSIQRSSDRDWVPALYDGLNEIPQENVTEESLERSFEMLMGIHREKWLGDGRLQGIWGRGVHLSTHTMRAEVSIENPLAAYVGDTLWYDTGYSFGAAVFVQTGVIYQITPSLFLSGRMGFGMDVHYVPEVRYRRVETFSGSAELIERTAEPSNSYWRVDNFMIPEFSIGFYFGADSDEK